MAVYDSLSFHSYEDMETYFHQADKIYCLKLFSHHPKLKRIYETCKKHSLKEIDIEECFFASIQLLFPESFKMRYRHKRYGDMHIITIPIPVGLVVEEKELEMMLTHFEGEWNPFMNESLSVNIDEGDIRVLIEENRIKCAEYLLGFMRLEWVFATHRKKCQSEVKKNECQCKCTCGRRVTHSNP